MPEIEYSDNFTAPRSLHDVGMRGHTVQVQCPICNHCRRFDPYAMWWLFEQRGWDDRLQHVPKLFKCVSCSILRRQTVWPLISVVDDTPNDDTLKRPDERTWTASVRRRRT